VLLTVSDFGNGIATTDLDKVFEPFFATNEGGEGPGLGLSMVYGFIKQSNGYIKVQSELGQGTSFKLYLPRYEGTVEENVVARKLAPVGGIERILVVEDDPQVRASVVRQLKTLGYSVFNAVDGTAGVAAFEATPQPFDLLLTDVVLPGPLNGKDLADEVARRWPRTRTVFMSGYTDKILSQEGRLDPSVRLLSKPFRKSDLALIVRQALDSGDKQAPA
jgi:CheY-like chemotaxis protein